MAAVNQKITTLVVGDDWRIERTYTGFLPNETIAKAYLTVKKRAKDADPGIFQRVITNVANAHGAITDVTSPDVSLYFDVTKALTALLKPGVEYVYDVQLHSADNDIWTAEIGVIIGLQGVTQAVS